METDPVCKMKVDPAKTKLKAEYAGKMYYFCSESCKKQFEREPSRYVK
ncbi:MAG: YHS domain-containing protein [Conexivisphaerales archaeon]